MQCLWCKSNSAKTALKTGYWELPDGTRAIKIREIPSIECRECGMEYQEDETVEQIEDQMMLINTKLLTNSVTYNELMSHPRLLKKNYFK